MKTTKLPNDTTALGYDKEIVAVGSVVQNIESNWIGRVSEFVELDGQTMIHCYHEYDGEPEIDDEAWFDPGDMVRIDRALVWSALWKAMRNYPDAWIETTESMYHEMLGAVPPLVCRPQRFLFGEPDHNNEKGETVYASFRKKDERYYAQYQTLAEFNLS